MSYKREDGERAKLIVDGLLAEGITVWWDRMIPAGTNWDKTIEAEISRARCVLVLWSKLSVASENVRCEADFARDAGVLVPVRLGSCELPLFHRMTQYIDLQTWSGEALHPTWQLLLERVKSHLMKDPRAEKGRWGFGIAPPKPQIWLRYNAAVRLVAGLIQDDLSGPKEATLSAIREMKGLFNRVRRKDQWDWFIVWQRFGLPPIAQLRMIVDGLQELRDAINESNDDRAQTAASRLKSHGTTTLLRRFLGEEQVVRSERGGVLFILSAKHHPDAVLVSVTKDDVVSVADQLSDRLGARTPFGIIHAWPVRDASSAKAAVFGELARHGFSSPLDRVLEDTRVLDCDYKKAVPIVDAALKAENVLGY